jgi:hypothetical protein
MYHRIFSLFSRLGRFTSCAWPRWSGSALAPLRFGFRISEGEQVWAWKNRGESWGNVLGVPDGRDPWTDHSRFLERKSLQTTRGSSALRPSGPMCDVCPMWSHHKTLSPHPGCSHILLFWWRTEKSSVVPAPKPRRPWFLPFRHRKPPGRDDISSPFPRLLTSPRGELQLMLVYFPAHHCGVLAPQWDHRHRPHGEHRRRPRGPAPPLLSFLLGGRLIRLKRIYNFWCSMLVFTPFALCFVTLRGVFMRFPELTY